MSQPFNELSFFQELSNNKDTRLLNEQKQDIERKIQDEINKKENCQQWITRMKAGIIDMKNKGYTNKTIDTLIYRSDLNYAKCHKTIKYSFPDNVKVSSINKLMYTYINTDKKTIHIYEYY